jgi:hypothetical protein
MGVQYSDRLRRRGLTILCWYASIPLTGGDFEEVLDGSKEYTGGPETSKYI